MKLKLLQTIGKWKRLQSRGNRSLCRFWLVNLVACWRCPSRTVPCVFQLTDWFPQQKTHHSEKHFWEGCMAKIMRMKWEKSSHKKRRKKQTSAIHQMLLQHPEVHSPQLKSLLNLLCEIMSRPNSSMNFGKYSKHHKPPLLTHFEKWLLTVAFSAHNLKWDFTADKVWFYF